MGFVLLSLRNQKQVLLRENPCKILNPSEVMKKNDEKTVHKTFNYYPPTE